MMKLLKIGMILAALLSCSTAFADTAAAASKIGILDMQQIMQESPQVASLNKTLQAQFKPRQDKIIAAQKSLQSDMDKLNKNAAVMSADDKTKLEDKINTERNAYQALVQNFQQDLSKAQSQAMQKFMTNLQTAVNDTAKKGGYSMIINRAAVPYFDPGLDVTKQILQVMGK